MTHPNMENFQTKFKRLVNLAWGLAIIDGGTVIGLQIMNFLLSFFYLKRLPNEIDLMGGIVALLSVLTLAVIIYRITWLLRGVKQNLVTSYLYSLRRLPLLILLYLIVEVVVLALSKPLLKVFMLNQTLVIFMVFALIPYGLLACIFIVDQRKSPFQALAATYNAIFNKIDFRLLLATSAMYGVPCLIGTMLATTMNASYITLAASLWLLFCHILTIVIYADSLDKSEATQSGSGDKATKVVII
jgi:hypothetical protein